MICLCENYDSQMGENTGSIRMFQKSALPYVCELVVVFQLGSLTFTFANTIWLGR